MHPGFFILSHHANRPKSKKFQEIEAVFQDSIDTISKGLKVASELYLISQHKIYITFCKQKA